MDLAASQRRLSLQSGEFSGERNRTQAAKEIAIDVVACNARIVWATSIFRDKNRSKAAFSQLFDQHKALEILTLGESHRHRVVGCAAHALGLNTQIGLRLQHIELIAFANFQAC